MAMLSRYQKPGGFIQLLQLIETCGKQKQENFLKIIEGEDPRWSEAIKIKMLTPNKILSWEDNTLGEIASRLNPLTLATLIHGLKEEDWKRMSLTFSHSQLRGIEDLKDSKTPTTSEISAAFVKLIEEVRLMIKEGYIRLEKIDPHMVVEDDIEDKINKTLNAAVIEKEEFKVRQIKTEGLNPTPPKPASEPSTNKELHSLRQKVHLLHTENTALKNEIKTLREKIAQIKKIA